MYYDQYDPEFNEKSITVSKALKREYINLAKQENIEFLAASDYAEPSNEDQEHLTSIGHSALANAIYDKIRSI